MTNGCTKKVYEERIDFYTTSLFDDVNVISSTILGIQGEERPVYLFPYQLKVVSQSKLKVKVVQSYFKGNGFLIESTFLNEKVFFESPLPFNTKSEVYLAIEN